MVPWAQVSAPKQYLNQFSHFCTAHPCEQHTDRHTDKETYIQTMSHVTSVAIGCISCTVCDAAK